MNRCEKLFLCLGLCLLIKNGFAQSATPKNFIHDPTILIGLKHANGKYKFDLPADIADCDKDVQQKIFIASPKAKKGKDFESMDPVPVWWSRDYAPYVYPKDLKTAIPQTVQQKLAKQWWLISDAQDAVINLEAALQGSENYAPCWIGLSSDWKSFEKIDELVKAEIVLATTEKEHSSAKLNLVRSKPINSWDDKTPIPVELMHRFQNTVLLNRALRNRIGDLLKRKLDAGVLQELNSNKPESPRLVTYHAFRAGIDGKNEDFLYASLYVAGQQATMTVNLTRNMLCRWHNASEDSVHGQMLLGVFDRYKSGTDDWLVNEYYYEGGNSAIIRPLVTSKSCELKVLHRTAYSGL